MNIKKYLLCAFLVLPACMGEKAPATQDGVFKNWKEAGLEVGAFAQTDSAPYGGGSCQAGQVAGLDVTLCQHAEPKQADAVKEQALKKVGNATGYALSQGKWVLVVADRKKVDRNGKSMNRLALAFQGKELPKQ